MFAESFCDNTHQYRGDGCVRGDGRWAVTVSTTSEVGTLLRRILLRWMGVCVQSSQAIWYCRLKLHLARECGVIEFCVFLNEMAWSYAFVWVSSSSETTGMRANSRKVNYWMLSQKD